MNWGWLERNVDTVLEDLREHVEIALIALLLGALIAFPMGLIAYRWRATYGPLLAITQVLYTVPSLALFVLLINLTGLGPEPVIIGLTIYSLVILVRNLVEGLRSVPKEVIDAATAMGYRRRAGCSPSSCRSRCRRSSRACGWRPCRTSRLSAWAP